MFNRKPIKDAFELHFDIRDRYSRNHLVRVSSEFALRQASAAGKIKDVLGLIPFVSNINEPGLETKRTAMHQAAINGHTQIFQILEQNGSSAYSLDSLNKSPLNYLCDLQKNDFLVTRQKYLKFFDNNFPGILNQIILGFLSYKDIVSTLSTSRYVYRTSLLIACYQALNVVSYLDEAKMFLKNTPYHQLQELQTILLMSPENKNNLGSGLKNGDYYRKNPYSRIILSRYLTVATCEELFLNHDYTSWLLSCKALLLFQKNILTNAIVEELVELPDVKLFSVLLRNGYDELFTQKVSIQSVFVNAEKIKILVDNFGYPSLLAEVVEAAIDNLHLVAPNYDFIGDITNSPYQLYEYRSADRLSFRF